MTEISIAQINVVAGHPRRNYETIKEKINDAKKDGADVVIFPEMCVPGYLMGDTWEKESFINDCLYYNEEIIKLSDEIAIIFGSVTANPENTNEDGRIRKYNCAIVANKGQIEFVQIKTLQPNYREFDDNRHFYDYRKELFDQTINGNQINLNSCYNHNSFKLNNGTRMGVVLCEDGWSNDYSISPMDYVSRNNDIIVNISCSPHTQGKNNKRNRVFSKSSKRINKPIIYVNNVGIQNNGKNIYAFDGESCLYKPNGSITNFYPPYKESCKLFNVEHDASECENNLTIVNNYESDLLKNIVYSTKEFTKQLGINKVVIGASGGIDSAVASFIFSQFIDSKNLHLVNMPSRFNSQKTKSLAFQLAKNLDCMYHVLPIEDSIRLTKKEMEELNFGVTDYIMENIQARDRSSRILSAISASLGGVFTCNANKSEMTVGYSTLYGDLGGFVAPLGDVWKTDVYKLARHINENFNNVIPVETINIKPSAELSNNQNIIDKGDPIMYEYHDLLFKSWVERWDRATPTDILKWTNNNTLEVELGYDGKSIVNDFFNGDTKLFIDDLEKWWNLYSGFSVAKRIQSPPIISVSRRALGFDHRESQISPYYENEYHELKSYLIQKNV